MRFELTTPTLASGELPRRRSARKLDTSKNPIWPQVRSKNSNGSAPREIAYLEVFRGVQLAGVHGSAPECPFVRALWRRPKLDSSELQ